MTRWAIAALLVPAALRAESGREAWLRYEALPAVPATPAVVVVYGQSEVLGSAREELLRGLHGMTGRTLRVERGIPKEDAYIIGTLKSLRAEQINAGSDLPDDAWRVSTAASGGAKLTVITGANDRGVLYGVFALLRRMSLGQPVEAEETPYAPVRWLNHWDNMDGSIERGYGGRSLFWDTGAVREDLTRASEYARLLASLGINGCSVNNVNANPKVITAEFLPEVARIAAAFRRWGVRLVLSVDFGSPKTLGGLDTFDPLDARVAAFWKDKAEEIYRAIPDLGGIVLKADSEGRVGPAAYNRTHADAANVIARPLASHGGLLFYRGFVYDHHMDWQNLKNDRARAAYDNFKSLDGKFDSNVVIQIKHGPIDFQVREPASPLFGALEKTSEAVELQITQEYFGQARHMVFLVPMWKEALDFDLQVRGAGTPVKALAAGKVFGRPSGGFIGVSNAGMDDNWYGNHFSQSNLYGFGRLAWNPNLSSIDIANEWTRQTFGANPKVVETIASMQLESWRTFEKYTGPLGLQTLTEMTGTHYGPAPEASERNGWGQWHRSDANGTGMDRTVATGTGYIGQYSPAVAKMYESLETCPDELLVFLHHVAYTYRLHSGKTVIQHIYDVHFEGAETAATWVRQWKSLAGLVDERRYREGLATIEYQAGHAEVWRDSVVSWFLKTSSIPDAKGRAGNYPGRVEAELMKLEGYAAKAATPWETASGGLAVECPVAKCAASFRFDGAPGRYTLRVQYFDRSDGVSHFRLLRGAQVLVEWDAADRFPSRKIDGASSTRKTVSGIALRPGDEIRIEGVSGGEERASFDYVELVKEPSH